MKEIVGEIFLDDVATVATANHKVVHAVRGIHFHNVPENRTTADFDHGLWFEMGFLGNSSSESTGKYDGFHWFSSPRGGESSDQILERAEWFKLSGLHKYINFNAMSLYAKKDDATELGIRKKRKHYCNIYKLNDFM